MFRTKKIRTALAAGAMTGALALSACAGGGGGGGGAGGPSIAVLKIGSETSLTETILRFGSPGEGGGGGTGAQTGQRGIAQAVYP